MGITEHAFACRLGHSPSPPKVFWSPELGQALRSWGLGQKLGFQPRSRRFGAAGT